MEFEHRALADAIVFITLGTVLLTYAVLLLADGNRDQRLPWTARGAVGLVDVGVANTIQAIGVVALVWGGVGLERFAATPLAAVGAVGPALALRVLVRHLHHRRLARTVTSQRLAPPPTP